jgi:hypothetical protein
MAVTYATARALDRRSAVATTQQQLQEPDISPTDRARLRAHLTSLNSEALHLSHTSTSVLHHSQGDRPNRPFFQKARQQQTKTSISQLTLPDGSQTSSADIIKSEMCSFWGQVFGEHLPSAEVLTTPQAAARISSLNRIHRFLTPDQQQGLEQPYVQSDLDAALKRIQKGVDLRSEIVEDHVVFPPSQRARPQLVLIPTDFPSQHGLQTGGGYDSFLPLSPAPLLGR